MNSVTEPMYTIEEAADRLRISVSTLSRRLRANEIGHRKDGRRVFISESHVRDYMKRTEVPPARKATR